MAGEAEVQVSHFLDEKGLGAFQIKLIVWSVLIAMIDGYDIGAIAFAAPHLLREWHITPKELGLLLSASNFGVLFGSQIFGWIGDRYGRKTALIAANLLFGVLTFAAAYATDITLAVLAALYCRPRHRRRHPQRGGDQRRVGAAQSARDAGDHCRRPRPARRGARRFRVRRLRPALWLADLFKIGGVVPVVIALAAIFGLSESIKYMTLHESQRGKMERLIAAIRPDFRIPPNARFVIEDEKQSPSSSPIYLFGNGLAAITPLTWLMFALNLMGYFFLISWTPTLMTAAKLPPSTAALAGAALQVGGTVGALLLCWWLQRQRFLAIAIMFVIAVPIVGSIGYAGLSSTTALLVATFFAGALVLGIQSGINVVGAMIYPTSLRANGSGWQLGIGRLGAIIGPVVGSLLIGLPVPHLYMWSALPFAAGAVVTFVIYQLNKARVRADPELAKAQ